MSFDKWTALVRNFLCVIKSLLPSTNILMKSANLNFLPLSYFGTLLFGKNTIYWNNQTLNATYIEWMIAPTQLIASILSINGGYKNLLKSYKKYNILSGQRELCRSYAINKNKHIEYYVIEDCLFTLLNQEFHNIISSLLELICGFCFIFLFTNSLHIHADTHPKPVIDALIIMNIALIYFLYIMWDTYLNRKISIIQADSFCNSSHDKKKKMKLTSTLDLFQVLASVGIVNVYEGFKWLSDDFHLKYEDVDVDTENGNEGQWNKIIINDFATITSFIDNFTTKNVRDDIELINKLKNNSKRNNKMQYLDIAYFILNVIAFYGYTIGILAYYCPFDSYQDSITMMLFKLGMTDDTGDYWGNFAGDLAWTVEPFIILFVAPLISQDDRGSIVNKDNDHSSSSSSSRIRSKSKTSTKSRGRSKSSTRKKKDE